MLRDAGHEGSAAHRLSIDQHAANDAARRASLSAISMSPTSCTTPWATLASRGIQRVQLNLIGHLVRRLGGNDAVRHVQSIPIAGRCSSSIRPRYSKATNSTPYCCCDVLGLSGTSRIFPSTGQHAQLPAPHTTATNSSARRSRPTSSSRHCCFPRRLAAMGLRRPSAAELAVVPVSLRPHRSPADQARLVFLGATWSLPRTTAFGREHAAQGGIVVQLVYDLIPRASPRSTSRAAWLRDFNSWLSEVVRYTRRIHLHLTQWTAAEFAALRRSAR